MDIFGSAEQGGIDLSDDAIYADVEGDGVIEESNDDGSPTEPSENIEEVAEGEISQEEPAEQVETEAQKEPEQTDILTRLAELEKQSKAAQQGMTQAFQDRSVLQKRNSELETELAQLREAAQKAANKPLTEDEQKAWMERFIANPQETLAEQLAPIIQQVKAESGQQAKSVIEQQRREMRLQQDVAKAREELIKDFPAMADNTHLEQFAPKLVEISRELYGDDNGWTKNPLRVMREAAIELYGLPKKVDQKLLDEATQKAQQKAVEELRQREAGKGSAAPANTGGVKNTEPTEEDDIIKGIASARISGVF